MALPVTHRLITFGKWFSIHAEELLDDSPPFILTPKK